MRGGGLAGRPRGGQVGLPPPIVTAPRQLSHAGIPGLQDYFRIALGAFGLDSEAESEHAAQLEALSQRAPRRNHLK